MWQQACSSSKLVDAVLLSNPVYREIEADLITKHAEIGRNRKSAVYRTPCNAVPHTGIGLCVDIIVYS